MKQKPGTFFCFSPPVMIATFAIELVMAVYVVWRYKLNSISRIAVLLLVFLATFQLAEFMVCTGSAAAAMWWSRIGYTAIALLPPLGIHLAYQLAGAKKRPWIWPAYGTAAAFAVYFASAGQSIAGQACLGNYVIFELAPAAGSLFAAYYYGWLAIGIMLAVHLGKQVQAKRKRYALFGLIAGYASFIVPTVVVNVASTDTVRGIPSIMCGFAVLFAFILVGWILPVSQPSKGKKQ